MTFPRFYLAVAIISVLSAGCGTAGSAVPGTVAPSGVEVSSGTTASSAPVGYDSAPTATLIRIERVSATIAGVQGSSEVTLYGDGRMVSTSAGKSTQQRISADLVGELMSLASVLRGEADPGSPVTDVGWTDVEIHLEAQTITFRMGDIPSGPPIDQMSPVGRSRNAITALVTRFASVEALPVTDLPSSSGTATTSGS